MSALSAARTNISNKGQILYSIGHKTAASQTFYNGAMVALSAAGKLVPAATTASQRVVGVVDLGNLNSYASALDDELSVKVGIFPFANGTSTDACTDADAGNMVYVLDDQTVSRLPGAGRPIAGQLVKIENSLCYVSGVHIFPGGNTGLGAGTLWQGMGSMEDVAAPGALSVLTHITRLTTIDGTDAFTLAAGLFVGQPKAVIVNVVGANTPVGTVTPSPATTPATVTALGALGDSAEWVWNGSLWVLVSSFGCTFT